MQRRPDNPNAPGSSQEKPPPCPTWSEARDKASEAIISALNKNSTFRIDELEQWNLNAAECSGCLTVVPHNQLYVCMKKTCAFALKQETAIRTPGQFYNDEKVFCGRCSFRGCHSSHARSMEPAEEMAIRFASDVAGGELEEMLVKLALLNHEEPVDYMISTELKTKELPLIPVVEYLYASGTASEWLKKKKTVEAVHEAVSNCRQGGHSFVLKKAKEALDTYMELEKDVDHDLCVVKPDILADIDARMREHADRMRSPPRINNKRSPRGPPPRSSAHPNNSPGQRNQVKPSPTSQAAAPNSSAVVQRNPAGPSDTENVRPNREAADENVVTVMCNSLTQRFDSIRNTMQLEEALRDVSNALRGKTGSDAQKRAAAEMFKAKTNFDLSFPSR